MVFKIDMADAPLGQCAHLNNELGSDTYWRISVAAWTVAGGIFPSKSHAVKGLAGFHHRTCLNSHELYR